MKQTKKQEDWKAITLALIIMMIIILFQRAYFPTTKQYCNNFPDECVCENYDFKDCEEAPFDEQQKCLNSQNEIIITCQKFRKKTQAEFNIDDCNDNPREDDLCKCEEYQIIKNEWEESLIICIYSRILSNNHTYLFNVTLPKYSPSYNLNQCFPILDSNVEFVNKTESQITHYDKETTNNCLNSRPKTDYEKRPENYVAERHPKNCLRIEGNKCYISEPISSQGCWNGSAYLCGGGSSGIFIELKTTYRLKNECEKGNPDWVEETKRINDEIAWVDCWNNNCWKKDETDGCGDKCLNQTSRIHIICREKTEFG